MSATNSFKNWMAAKLGRILRLEIKPSEITIGPSIDGTPSKIEITYKGDVYPIVYDKYPIAELFGGGAAPVGIPGPVTTVAEATLRLNARYGLGLRDVDVVQGPIVPTDTTVVFKITPVCYEYTGELQVPIV